MAKLLPCPFCGGEVELLDFTDRVYGFWDYKIKCKKCRAYMDSPSTAVVRMLDRGLEQTRNEETMQKSKARVNYCLEHTHTKRKDRYTMKYYGKFCIVCGRRIPELSLRTRTCSEFCRSRYKCGYAPYKDYKELPYDDLTSIQEEAQNAGMTYGKYVATQNIKNEESKPMAMMRMECPFYKRAKDLILYCEGGILRFPDNDAKSELVLGYCSHPFNWRKCTIAHCLENYHFRKEGADI